MILFDSLEDWDPKRWNVFKNTGSVSTRTRARKPDLWFLNLTYFSKMNIWVMNKGWYVQGSVWFEGLQYFFQQPSTKSEALQFQLRHYPQKVPSWMQIPRVSDLPQINVHNTFFPATLFPHTSALQLLKWELQWRWMGLFRDSIVQKVKNEKGAQITSIIDNKIQRQNPRLVNLPICCLKKKSLHVIWTFLTSAYVVLRFYIQLMICLDRNYSNHSQLLWV